MPPPQPLLSEQAAFAKHLFTQGYPLWNPDPDLLPRARQSVGLRIGDVGTVDERGRFDFFFNILESLPGSAGSPPNFPPIEDDDVRCGGEDLLPREAVSSPETPWDADQLEVLDDSGVTRRTTQYGATLSDDGAHIILPQGAQSFELGLHHRRLFENHAREHGADWLERFRYRLGWPRSNSLYLLTGFYKTCSWSIGSFSMQTAANTNPVHVHCTLVEVDERTMREASVWQPTGRFKRKIGPPPDRQGQNNQTIFIRGITVTPNRSEQGSSEQREPGLLSRLFSSTRFLNPLVGDSTKATATETSKSSVIIQHVPQISQVSHPSEIINQYLLAREPSAKIAVTHDSQWIDMLKQFKGGQSWTMEDLKSHLKALVPVHYSIIMHNDTVYLRGKEDRSQTHFGVNRSRLPGDLAMLQPVDNPENRHMLRSLLDMNIVADDELEPPSPSSTSSSSSSTSFGGVYGTQALQPSVMTFRLSETMLQPVDDPENRHMLRSLLDMNIVADDEPEVTSPSPSSAFPSSSSTSFRGARFQGPSMRLQHDSEKVTRTNQFCMPVPSSSSMPFPTSHSPTNSCVGDQRPSGSKKQKGSKMHPCEQCKKVFPRPSGLATHMNSHSGVKPYKCIAANCEKSFAVRSNAMRHLRTHGINPLSPDVLSNPRFTVGFEASRYRWITHNPSPHESEWHRQGSSSAIDDGSRTGLTFQARMSSATSSTLSNGSDEVASSSVANVHQYQSDYNRGTDEFSGTYPNYEERSR